jgi:hypothetical protein
MKKIHAFVATGSANKSKSTKRKEKRLMKTLIGRVGNVFDSVQHYVENAEKINSASLAANAIVDEYAPPV